MLLAETLQTLVDENRHQDALFKCDLEWEPEETGGEDFQG